MLERAAARVIPAAVGGHCAAHELDPLFAVAVERVGVDGRADAHPHHVRIVGRSCGVVRPETVVVHGRARHRCVRGEVLGEDRIVPVVGDRAAVHHRRRDVANPEPLGVLRDRRVGEERCRTIDVAAARAPQGERHPRGVGRRREHHEVVRSVAARRAARRHVAALAERRAREVEAMAAAAVRLHVVPREVGPGVEHHDVRRDRADGTIQILRLARLLHLEVVERGREPVVVGRRAERDAFPAARRARGGGEEDGRRRRAVDRQRASFLVVDLGVIIDVIPNHEAGAGRELHRAATRDRKASEVIDHDLAARDRVERLAALQRPRVIGGERAAHDLDAGLGVGVEGVVGDDGRVADGVADGVLPAVADGVAVDGR